MRFNLTVTDDDYIKFNEYHIMNSKAGKSLLWLIRLILPVLAVTLIIIMYFAGMERGLLIAECSILAILTVVWQLKAKKIMGKSVRESIKKTKKDGRLPYYPESEIDFTEKEIIETSENSVQKLPYDEVRLVGDTPEHIFILIGAMQGIIMPKSCLNGQEEELKTFLKSKIHS